MQIDITGLDWVPAAPPVGGSSRRVLLSQSGLVPPQLQLQTSSSPPYSTSSHYLLSKAKRYLSEEAELQPYCVQYVKGHGLRRSRTL